MTVTQKQSVPGEKSAGRKLPTEPLEASRFRQLREKHSAGGQGALTAEEAKEMCLEGNLVHRLRLEESGTSPRARQERIDAREADYLVICCSDARNPTLDSEEDGVELVGLQNRVAGNVIPTKGVSLDEIKEAASKVKEGGLVLVSAHCNCGAVGEHVKWKNAGMGDTIAAHLGEQAAAPETVQIEDLTDRLGKIDIQGPAAVRILAGILADPEAVFENLPYFAFKGYFETADFAGPTVLLKNGTPVLVSRTGYTGEFGFELFVTADAAVALWEDLLAAGEAFGLVPCGLAARDSLRAGAVLPLSHQDIGHWPFRNHPWPFALPWDESQAQFTKTFVGSQALLADADTEYTLPYAGFDLRKVTDLENTVVVDEDDRELGAVLTCATDMGIGRVQERIFSVASPDKPEGFKAKGLCCGFVKVKSNLPAGTRIFLKDSRRKLKAVIADDIRPDRTARRPLKEML